MTDQRELPLEPGAGEIGEMGAAIVGRIAAFVEGLPARPTPNQAGADEIAELTAALLAAPPEQPSDLDALLDTLDRATACAMETAGPGHMAYIPGSGLLSSAFAELYARAVNRYDALAFAAPAFVALEESVMRWIACDVCGLPEGSSGLLTTGGSMATFSAVVAARNTRLGEQIADGTVYVTHYAHHSVTKATRLAGLPARNIRVVPCSDGLRMDPDAATAMIAADRAAGLRPFLLVGSAGTTDTGSIDPLPSLATVARREQLWFHVDAAYGGFFRLTERGQRRLAGLEQADSVTLDPHKSLFLPFGTGALVVRDPAALAAAHGGTADYLQDVGAGDGLPNYAQLGPELTHEARGIRAWLPLHLHGVGAFRDALEEKLDLAEHAYERLVGLPGLEVPWRPELSLVAFRIRPEDDTARAAAAADQRTRQLLERINASGRVLLSSTVVDGRQTLRICILAHRTHLDRVDEALDIVAAETTGLAPAG